MNCAINDRRSVLTVKIGTEGTPERDSKRPRGRKPDKVSAGIKHAATGNHDVVVGALVSKQGLEMVMKQEI